MSTGTIIAVALSTAVAYGTGIAVGYLLGKASQRKRLHELAIIFTRRAHQAETAMALVQMQRHIIETEMPQTLKNENSLRPIYEALEKATRKLRDPT